MYEFHARFCANKNYIKLMKTYCKIVQSRNSEKNAPVNASEGLETQCSMLGITSATNQRKRFVSFLVVNCATKH